MSQHRQRSLVHNLLQITRTWRRLASKFSSSTRSHQSTRIWEGFDDRKLLKSRLPRRERQLPDFNLIDGLEIVSQEGP